MSREIKFRAIELNRMIEIFDCKGGGSEND